MNLNDKERPTGNWSSWVVLPISDDENGPIPNTQFEIVYKIIIERYTHTHTHIYIYIYLLKTGLGILDF